MLSRGSNLGSGVQIVDLPRSLNAIWGAYSGSILISVRVFVAFVLGRPKVFHFVTERKKDVALVAEGSNGYEKAHPKRRTACDGSNGIRSKEAGERCGKEP